MIWKQWKRGKCAKLRHLGIGRDLAAQTTGSPHGPWLLANRSALTRFPSLTPMPIVEASAPEVGCTIVWGPELWCCPSLLWHYSPPPQRPRGRRLAKVLETSRKRG